MELQNIYTDDVTREHAIAWLTERGDLQEQREQRLETLEWGILIFVIVGVILDALLVFHEFSH